MGKKINKLPAINGSKNDKKMHLKKYIPQKFDVSLYFIVAIYHMLWVPVVSVVENGAMKSIFDKEIKLKLALKTQNLKTKRFKNDRIYQ